MARVTQVQHSRNENHCGKCGTVICIGDPYRHASPRAHRATAGRKLVRCMKPNCGFKQSDLTTSKMSGVYAAQEGLQEVMTGDFTPNDLNEALSSAADEVREIEAEYRESAQNIEDGFGHETSQSQEMTEKADALAEYADILEGVSLDDADEFDELDEALEGCKCHPTCDGCEESEERQQEIRDDVQSTVEDAISELSI